MSHHEAQSGSDDAEGEELLGIEESLELNPSEDEIDDILDG